MSAATTFSSDSSSTVPDAQIATQANNTVLGNVSGATASPAALSQAQITALLVAASASLPGAMTAAQFSQLLGLGIPISAAAFSGTSVTVSWTTDLYRRIEIHMKKKTGTAGQVKLVFTGLATGQQFTTGEQSSAAGTWLDKSFAANDNFVFDGSAIGIPAQFDIQAQVKNDGTNRSISGRQAGATGQALVFTGTSLDTTHNVSGLTFTFSDSSTGWLEVIGFL